MKIVFGRQASKVLQRLPTNGQDLLAAKIDQLASDPASLRNNVKPLVGSASSRLRVGDWRVVFEADGDTLVVKAIAPRGSAYG